MFKNPTVAAQPWVQARNQSKTVKICFSNETPRLILHYKHLANNKVIVYKKAVLNKLSGTSYR